MWTFALHLIFYCHQAFIAQWHVCSAKGLGGPAFSHLPFFFFHVRVTPTQPVNHSCWLCPQSISSSCSRYPQHLILPLYKPLDDSPGLPKSPSSSTQISLRRFCFVPSIGLQFIYSHSHAVVTKLGGGSRAYLSHQQKILLQGSLKTKQNKQKQKNFNVSHALHNLHLSHKLRMCAHTVTSWFSSQ